jgi:hypothetical protein
LEYGVTVASRGAITGPRVVYTYRSWEVFVFSLAAAKELDNNNGPTTDQETFCKSHNGPKAGKVTSKNASFVAVKICFTTTFTHLLRLDICTDFAGLS